MIFKLIFIAIHSIKSTFFNIFFHNVSTLIITHIFICLAENIGINVVSITFRLTSVILIKVASYDLIINYYSITLIGTLIDITLNISLLGVTLSRVETVFFPLELLPLVSITIGNTEILLIFIYFYKWFSSWYTGWNTCIIEDIVVYWCITLWDAKWVLNVFVYRIWGATDDTFICLRVYSC